MIYVLYDEDVSVIGLVESDSRPNMGVVDSCWAKAKDKERLWVENNEKHFKEWKERNTDLVAGVRENVLQLLSGINMCDERSVNRHMRVIVRGLFNKEHPEGFNVRVVFYDLLRREVTSQYFMRTCLMTVRSVA